jgi:hypothetical protein
MSPDNSEQRHSPAIAGEIAEVQGIFPSDAALQDAIARLALAGFDRADLSLPQASPTASDATPEAGAATPDTDVDQRQARTLESSGAAAIGAMAAAGITVATGGAALAAAGAAVAVGAAAGGLVAAARSVAKDAQHDGREESAAVGQLVLSARVTDTARQAAAEAAMRAAGATQVTPVHRANAGLPPTP